MTFTDVSSPSRAAFDHYVAGGPSLWSHHAAPPITAAVRAEIAQAVWHPGASGSEGAPVVAYLEWRRDMNPARFDHYHPVLGPALAHLKESAVPVSPPLALPPFDQSKILDSIHTRPPVFLPPDLGFTSPPFLPSPPPPPDAGLVIQILTPPPFSQPGNHPCPVSVPEPATFALCLTMIVVSVACVVLRGLVQR